MDIEEIVKWQKEEKPFKTIVLDHASSFQNLILAELLQLDKIPEQLSWGLARQQDYGQCAAQFKEHIASLLELDCNVVIVAQEREFGNDEESSIVLPYVASALMPSCVGWLNPAVDYIVETFIQGKTKTKKTKVGGKEIVKEERVEGVDYCLRVAPHEVYTTKFRLPKGHKLPEYVVDPSYNKLMEIIKGD